MTPLYFDDDEDTELLKLRQRVKDLRDCLLLIQGHASHSDIVALQFIDRCARKAIDHDDACNDSSTEPLHSKKDITIEEEKTKEEVIEEMRKRNY